MNRVSSKPRQRLKTLTAVEFKKGKLILTNSIILTADGAYSRRGGYKGLRTQASMYVHTTTY
jgi:hypothetical protein